MDRKEALLQMNLAVANRIMELKKTTMGGKEFDNVSVAWLQYIEAIAKKGTTTMAQLSEDMGLSKPSITNMIAKLTNAGLVEKKRSSGDHRVYNVTLTDNGKRLVNQHQAAFAAFGDQVAEKLSESEIDTLVSLLSKIV